MKIMTQIQHKVDLGLEKTTDYLDRLSLRERVMVLFAGAFLICVGIGSALWSMHGAAEYQNTRLNELKALIVSMQGQVESMKPADDLALSSADKIQRVAQQQGLSVATQAQAEDKIQLIAQHENYAVLANFLSQIAQMGVSIEQLDMQKNQSEIKLTAIVH